ncbi:mdh1 [Symbiodinium sp. KB8]|nr:mdh1 [Symbiodinium sp. KB8]
MIARGGVFGDRAVDLRLLDIEAASDKLRAVGMELQDVASPFVLRCTCTTDPLEAFMDADVALLVGARPRGPGMLRKDLLAANAGIFKAQGAVLDEVASRDCKVVVVGNPANTNALLCMRSAPSLPKRNFTALTRLDQNRTAGMLAAKIGVPVSTIRNAVIWGNHSATQVPMVTFATVEEGRAVETVAARLGEGGERWVSEELVPGVQQRGKEVIAARGASSAASAASAICDHIRDWVMGSDGRVVSMAVSSDGNPFGVREGLIFSFPVVIEAGGAWRFASGFTIDEATRSAIEATQSELLEEREAALAATA